MSEKIQIVSLSELAERTAEKHFLSSIDPKTPAAIREVNIRTLDHLADQDGTSTRAKAELAKLVFKKNR